jgi:hypothetical protein
METTMQPRTIISIEEIIEEVCPHCHAPKHGPCKRNDGLAMIVRGDDDLQPYFHRERVLQAWYSQLEIKFGPTPSLDRALITYYAFIMMADAVAAKAEQMFEKKMSTWDIQAFFAMKAREVLKNEKLLD